MGLKVAATGSTLVAILLLVNGRNLCRTNFERIGNPCFKTNLREVNKEKCGEFLSLPLVKPDCSAWPKEHTVPKVYHSISGGSSPPLNVKYIAMANPDYRVNWHNDTTALEYLEKACGSEVAEAFRCFIPTAYRADLFRFCALAYEGGVYIDTDQRLLTPLEKLYSNCSHATIGHDWPLPAPVPAGAKAPTEPREEFPGYQMKILAGMPGSPLFRCMVSAIVSNVRKRYGKDQNVLSISGPALLSHCYDECNMEGQCAMRVGKKKSGIKAGRPFNESQSKLPTDTNDPMATVAITYRDTRHAAWPYSGMLGTDAEGYDTLLSFEEPTPFDFYNVERIQAGRNVNYKARTMNTVNHYSQIVGKGTIYYNSCKLKDWRWPKRHAGEE